MPWRGPEVPGEFPTLGYEVAEFIQTTCVIPDGNHAGEPFLLIEDMLRWLLWFYRIHPNAEPDPDKPSRAFVYNRGGQLVEPQKWGKGPFSAAVTCAEAEGPVLFDGWDGSGEPVGRPKATPHIQITAVSEDQTDNVWRALVPMIELGDLKAEIPDTGLTRINLVGGGLIEPVTSSARSRLGQRITFAVQDEAHDWTRSNGGRRLADNQRRNLAGMGGRFMETGNAWDPADESVAQQTWEDKEPGVFKMMGEAGPGSVRNKVERRRALRKVYKQSWWVDIDRIEAEVLSLLQRDPAQAERFFLNRIRAAEDAAFDDFRWAQLVDVAKVITPRSLITIGVDGARFDDALAVIATDVDSGHQWPLGIWEAPQNPPDNYEHPLIKVDGAMSDAFERYEVWRVYIDPQKIEHLVERWRGRWGEKRIVEWYMHRPRQTAYAVRAYKQAMTAGDMSHDGDADFTHHVLNAKRSKVSVYDDDRRQMWTISKDRPMSPRKIDAAAAAVLSWTARGDAIAAGANVRRSSIYEERGVELV